VKLPRLLAVWFLVCGTSIFCLPYANAEQTGQITVTCANEGGTAKEFRVGWDNTTGFFEGKGNIAALFCSIGTQGQYKTYVSTTASESTLYYNGIAPTPLPSSEPTPTPSPSPSPEPSPTPTAEPSASPSPAPTVTPTPEPVPTNIPASSASPTPSVDTSTVTSSVDTSTVTSPLPTPLPNPEPQPTPVPVEPAPTPVVPPVVEPQPQPQPTPVPTPLPEPEPAPTPVDPAPEPPVAVQPPEPSPEPLPQPEPAPQPVPVEEPPVEAPAPEPLPVEEAPLAPAEEPPVPVEEPPAPAPEPPAEEVPAPQVPELAPEPAPQPPAIEPAPPVVATENSTPEERAAVAEAIIEAAQGEPVTAQAIQDAGLTYEDLPPDTPVEVRQDENGNEVVITAEVAAALVVLENPAALVEAIFTDPAQALLALASIGADMSEEERAESEKIIVASVIAGQAAVNAAGMAGAAAYRRKP